ncbi:hypothetical protein OZ248_004073 [Salmonella enterica]|uniref:thiamine pyrophosphate-dependent enzyme n=1 Tax=Salmonella enterica TaxID=28901 RepID=UPI000FA51B6E|nr:hypothetical protein [Salmonella enterica]ECC2869971.1 hypothetical protein [Salmonella enterica subsp. enterica serovar Tanger]ECO0976167.1 hypothetical protein [Salmonella enterica subsp. enterica serovar Newport]EDU8781300.1 hypothetical protein [Salmonella enterica subsp. enterica]EBI6522566.1 hypothetical protein [Salmonella enterica]
MIYISINSWSNELRIPAGIGASFTSPERKCMVITGDSCMLMQCMELDNSKKI